MKTHRPTRTLREHPDLDQLRRQAKELLAAFAAGETAAAAEVDAHFRSADPATFALHDAQLVLARSYGFDSWPKLKAYVEGVNVKRLADAVRAGDVEQVRALLKARPELVNTDMAENNEHRAIHYAVLARAPEMVRVLMEHGADARKGIYPHRDATSALVIAIERGYEEIVAIIHEAEQRRSKSPRPAQDLPAPASGLLSTAVRQNQPEELARLLDQGLDPDERTRLEDVDETFYTWGMPLHHCAGTGKYAMAEMLLARGADPNGQVYASGSVMYSALHAGDAAMVALLERYGGFADAATAGHLRLTDRARQMLADQDAGRLRPGTFMGESLVDELLWAALRGGDPEIVRMTLERVGWPRDDSRWFGKLWSPLPQGDVRAESEHALFLDCFRQVLGRCDPSVRHGSSGRTVLHDVATENQALDFATLLLDAGARTDVRDNLLQSTPLGWACRWGRIDVVKLLLDRGADPVESGAEPWATPRAWAEKMGHRAVLAIL